MKLAYLLVIALLAVSVAIAEMTIQPVEQPPSPIEQTTTTQPEKIISETEKIRERPAREIACTIDVDCYLAGIVCPMVIGNPMCVNGKCMCGPGRKVTINETKITICWDVRVKMREMMKEISEEKNESKKGELINEFLRIKEEYKDCFPQPVPMPPMPIAEIAKKYAVEKMKSVEEFREAMKELKEEMLNNITTQNLTGKQLAEIVHEYNKKRKELVKEFVEKMHEINMERMEEIKEVVVGKHAEWEGEKLVNVTKITVTVNGKTIEIQPGDNVTISVEGVIVKSTIPLKVKNETIEDAETNETIKETPDKVKERIERARERVREMKLERKAGIPVYSIAAVRAGKILGIIPVNVNVNYEIAATNGTTISISRPWWSFLVFG